MSATTHDGGLAGPRISQATYDLANILRVRHSLSDEKYNILLSVIHTMTFYKTYTHSELESMLGVLLP